MFEIQDDLPKHSLIYIYGPDDPNETHGGFTGFNLTAKSATATFYKYTGKLMYVKSAWKNNIQSLWLNRLRVSPNLKSAHWFANRCGW